MPLDITIPIERQDGNKYLLHISEFKTDFIFDIPIVDVQFIMAERDIHKPALNELLFIRRELVKFLKDNDVVLYYYCDSVEAPRSKKHQSLKPQEYRHLLFNQLFEMSKADELIKDDIIITNDDSHFISLISNVRNRSTLTQISTEIEKINDK